MFAIYGFGQIINDPMCVVVITAWISDHNLKFAK